MSTKAKVSSFTDLEKSDKYQRALSLNLDCGSDTMRKLIEKLLDDRSKTFKQYVKDPTIQTKIKSLKQKKALYAEQVKVINSKDPHLDCMDVTLLTLILLELFTLTQSQEQTIKKLRKKRNELAHKPRSMLEDDVPFNVASQLIIDLAKCISAEFEKEISKQIQELKKRELIRTRSNMEIIQLSNESLTVKLVEAGESDKVDGNSEMWIKLGLTKYVRQLSRFLEVDVLLQDLKTEGVVSDTLKRKIEETYNYEEQMQLLVLQMMDETRENLLKFCECVRKKNSLLANLLHQSADEREISTKLLQEETSRLGEIIKESFMENKKSSIACEDVHIFVEAERKCPTPFHRVQGCILETFPSVNFEENDSRFHGIAWKDNRCSSGDDKLFEDDEEEVLIDMPCDRFGEYLSVAMERVKQGIGVHFEQTASDECISAEIFSKLTDAQMEELFSYKLKEVGINFGFGIRSSLSEIQKRLKRQLNRHTSEKSDILRKFDTPTEKTTYTKSTVKPSSGNLLIPAHLFICPSQQRQCNSAYMAKEVVRFALACINGKKNGTVHFGIKEAGNGCGDIKGLPKEFLRVARLLDEEIYPSIRNCCDKGHQAVVERCIRPVQVIPVEEDRVVLEVDIVPFSAHIRDPFIRIRYPPKGFQRQKCFFFKENSIQTIEQSKLESVREDFEQMLKERVQLEKDIEAPDTEITQKATQKLKKLLTGGNKYVTDAFIPIICSGEMSECMNKADIHDNLLLMSTAFTSAAAVFDFNSSVELRNGVEKGNTYFLVRMAEDYTTKRSRRESDISGDCSIWLYSNGNEELGKDKMTSELWYANRLGGVKNALQQLRQEIPFKRGLVIFLVFQKPTENDPLLEIARETFLTTFKDECIVIAENEGILQDWQKEMRGKLTEQDLESKVVTGLTWEEVSMTIQGVFKPHMDVLFRFPDGKGRIVEMTSREKDELQLNDIELVDGNAAETCKLQEEQETVEDSGIRRSKEQEMFYKGNSVTWWNFYYPNQVGKRDAYDTHKENMKIKLSYKNSKDRYETHEIEHNPGAGGTTLAFHLLWHFSQVKQSPEKAYRCCVVKKITEKTAEEIYRFQSFKQKDMAEAKPVIVLVDNKSEEHVNILKERVDEIAYKKGSPGKLFCLLLFVIRVPVSHKSRAVIVKHNLSKQEKMWFQKKFEELKESSVVPVNTLIAFNVMRHSFDQKYIEDTTQHLVSETQQTERKLLGCLSVISSLDSDSPVPETVFDSLMLDKWTDPNTLTWQECLNRPFGIVLAEKQRCALQKVERETWNVNLSDAMQLLITHRMISRENYSFHGVCLLSQPLAKAVLKYIIIIEVKSFQEMVYELLELVKLHAAETNQMSKHFLKIVCSLFTSRESYTDDKGETKVVKFSPMILQLEEQQESESTEDVHLRVVEVVEKCFRITNNAMVGQQLARYYIHIKDFQAAEETIQRCLNQLPHNSYILDTYGQIYRTKMEQLFADKSDKKVKNDDAVESIDLAFKAVQKFRLAQEASTMNEDYTSLNSNSFLMEVTTALCLLDNFSRFECYDKNTFWAFLNEDNFNVEKSSYQEIMQRAPVLEEFRKGRDMQQHLEKSLRTLEERAYMTRVMSVVFTASKDVLLLRPREKFEMYYGSKEHTSQFEFLYGVGLKLLMNAYCKEDSKPKFKKRVEEAENRLEHGVTIETERDLMVFLGYYLIAITTQEVEPNLFLYRKLVNYSARLYKIQQRKGIRERRYVEAYLYYALFHWILPSRAESGIENLSHPDIYKTLLKEWEDVYMQNHHIKNTEYLLKSKPKIYFALGCGKPGNDIVDLECLRKKWREAMQKIGRKMKEVKSDNHWSHPIFEERLERLSGTVDSNGKSISTEVCYNQRSYTFKVRTLENFAQLSNRGVTFVLGFSWMSLVALDVRKSEKSFRRQLSQSSVNHETAPKSVDEKWKHNSSGSSWTSDSNQKEEGKQRRPDSIEAEYKNTSKNFSPVAEHTQKGDKTSQVCKSDGKIGQASSVIYKNPNESKDHAGREKLQFGDACVEKTSGVVFTSNKHKKNVATCGSEMSVQGSVTESLDIVGQRSAERKASKGRGDGQGRGRGRGREKDTAFPKSHAKSPVIHRQTDKNKSVTLRIPADGQTTEKLSTISAGTSSEMEDSSQKGTAYNVSPADIVAVSSTQRPDTEHEDAEGWLTVGKKKKPAVGKKEPVNQSAEGSSSMAQKNFDDLIKKCQRAFPSVPRERIVAAYNNLKAKHAGSLKGCSQQYIIDEIGKQL